MKKIILLFTLLFMTFSSYGQDSKFYLGVGAGYATTGGDLNSDNNYKGGLHMNFLNLGLKSVFSSFSSSTNAAPFFSNAIALWYW